MGRAGETENFMHYVKTLLSASVVVVGIGVLSARDAPKNTARPDFSHMSKEQILDMPYAQVKAALSNPDERVDLLEAVKKDNIILMGGQAVEGKELTMKGELTGANCYLSRGIHGHEHALCAKACVLAGSPVIFLADDGKVYTVLTPEDGRPLPEKALDELGQPGISVHGKLVEAHGQAALALESVGS
jgi:hypothetical protein